MSDSAAVESVPRDALEERAEAATRKSDARYRAVFNQHLQYVAILSPEGLILDINDLSLQIAGVTREQVVGRVFWWTELPGVKEWWSEALAAAAVSDSPVRRESKFDGADGETRDVEVTVTAVRDAAGGLDYYIAEGADHTDRKRAEASARDSEERLIDSINASPVPKLLADGARVTSVNPAFVQAFGYTHEDIGTLSDWWGRAFPDPDQRDAAVDAWAQLVRETDQETSANVQPLELTVRCKNGAVKTILASPALIGRSSKALQMIVLYDITERKEREEMLRRSEGLLRIAGHAASLGGWSIDLPDLRVTWSDEVCNIHERPIGTTPDIKDAIEFYAPEWREVVRAAFWACAEKGLPYDLEVEGVTSKGNRVWVRSIGVADFDARGVVFRVQGALQDITPRKRHEIELLASNRALQMLSSCNEALIRADDEQALIQRICDIAVDVGRYRIAAVGYALLDEASSIVVKARAGEVAEPDSNLRSWAEDGPGGLGPAGRTVRSGELVVVDECASEPDLIQVAREAGGKGLGRCVYLPLRNPQRTFGVLALYADGGVSTGSDELRLLRELADDLAFGIGNIEANAAREKAEEALRSSLKEKEVLLKEVHHRVKNNMQVITSLLRLEGGRTDHSVTRGVLKAMQNRIQAMALLHEALYRSGNFANLDLGVYLKMLVDQLARSLALRPNQLQLHLDLASVGIDMDNAIPCGLLVNELVSNAFKHAFPDGRSGTVHVELRRLDQGSVRLRVSDDGIGLPDDFETRRGQSLGLQLVADLARQLQGRVEGGPGSTFTVTFNPRIEGAAARLSEVAQEPLK